MFFIIAQNLFHCKPVFKFRYNCSLCQKDVGIYAHKISPLQGEKALLKNLAIIDKFPEICYNNLIRAGVCCGKNFGGFFMYQDIGKKIKGAAKTVFGLSVAGECIASIVWMVILSEAAQEEEAIGLFFVIFFLALPFSIFLAYVSTWLLYGFGELVDKTCDIEQSLRQMPSGQSGSSVATDGPSRVPSSVGTLNRIPDLDEKRKRELDAMLAQGLITEDEYRQIIG